MCGLPKRDECSTTGHGKGVVDHVAGEDPLSQWLVNLVRRALEVVDLGERHPGERRPTPYRRVW